MNEKLAISKKKPKLKSQQYDFLRSEGLKHIEALSKDIWTDYNVHDPGITILEVLCYAITDLGYRLGLPVQDLLAIDGNNFKAMHEQFASAINILPSGPVTETDYRKLLIDIPGINNAWLLKHEQKLSVDLKDETFVTTVPDGHHSQSVFVGGIYDIVFEPDNDVVRLKGAAKQKKTDELIAQVKKTFHENRNLCEDLHNVSVVPEHEVVVCADVELVPGAEARRVHAEILFAIEQYLSPLIRHYTLQELLSVKNDQKKSKRVEEVFEGPRLKNGFLDSDEIESTTLREVIYTSDIINLMMDIEGVVAVKKIVLNYCEDDMEERSLEWSLQIKKGHKAKLCRDKSLMRFFKDVIPAPTSLDETEELLDQKYRQVIEARKAVLTTDLPFPGGEYRHTGEYTSIMHHFPQTYGVGDAGLSARVSEERKSQARQLKAYLLFFDQMLANYLAQLNHVRDLFSAGEKVTQTYFSHMVNHVKDIEECFFVYDEWVNESHSKKKKDEKLLGELYAKAESKLSEHVQAYTEEGSGKSFLSRRHRFLDHLLARFNETLTEYSLHQFTLEGEAARKALLGDKISMLNDYPGMSYRRNSGFNYHHNETDEKEKVAFWDTDNISGLERRLACLFGFDNFNRRSLSSDEPGIHLIEHLLLRPEVSWLEKSSPSDPDFFMPVCIEEDCKEDCGLDPYSFRVSIILPAYAKHFTDVNYRRFLENVIRMETPAHILPRICWVEKTEMKKFESVFREWLEIKTSGKINSTNGKKAVAGLNKILFDLRSIHPDGELSPPDLKEKQPENPAVLGRTQLSKPKEKKD